MNDICLNLQNIQNRIAQVCKKINRSVHDVQLLAVSKTFGPDAIAQAVTAGQRTFGENYVAEAVTKIQHFSAHRPELHWHMIGSIQSNKTKTIAQHFQWVHSVDRLKIAQKLSTYRPELLPDLQICLEVNVSNEANKGGLAPDEVKPVALEVARLPRLQLRGLMCIPQPAVDFEVQRKPFALLRELFLDLQRAGLPLDTLSMGMSDDLEAAICEGATIIRVGRGIFGARHYGKPHDET